jgi:hypothetical protein
MFNIVLRLLEWVAKGGIASFLVHAGISVVVFAGLDILITEALDLAIGHINSLPVDILNIALLAGLDNFFYIIGSAFLTKVAIDAAMRSMGLRMNNGGS